MISKLLRWLGSLFASFLSWLGNIFISLFRVLIDTINNCLTWLYDLITSLAVTILDFVLSLIPSVNVADVSSAISFMRRAWNTFDVFVPLHEGLVFVTIYFTFYFSIKLVALVVRVVLGLIP